MSMASSSSSSSSSSSASPRVKYDVFLSFRGEDTRNNFTGHLYAALRRFRINTFMDYRLGRGDEILSSLLDAINVSQISVVIFSQNYAASRWCLQELEQILLCREMNEQIVLPVFYHVDPSHVRKQTGRFGEAFADLLDRFKDRLDEQKRWKVALKKAGNLSGHVMDKEKPESELIENIVDDILVELEYLSSYRMDLVGVGSRIEEIISKLRIESDGVHVLGIWGMGGIGKTTICKAVFNKIKRFTKGRLGRKKVLIKQFDSYYFAEDVREKSERSSELASLKKELFSAILDDDGSDICLSTFTKERLSRKKVFIVFDDVTHFEQIEKLIRHPNYLGSGSRIIITTRDKHVLESCGINNTKIYQVEGLCGSYDLQLFTKHAFGEMYPPKDYVELSLKMILYAKGVPLALKVLGSFLRCKTKQYWENAMKKLDKYVHEDIQKVLKISYDGLDKEDRKIFLDVACFFKGWKSNLVKNILDASGFFPEIGLSNLIDKCLITVSNDTITMHDLLQEMGRTIVRIDCNDPSKYNRLWDDQDIYNVLRKNSGTKVVEGISLNISKISDINIKRHAFAKMYNLRIFIVYNSNDHQNKLLGFEDLESFSMELICFSWERYPFKSLPPNFHAENLVSLYMPSSKVKQLWNGVQNLVKLKHVDLNDSRHLREIPDLSKAVNLQELILRDCKSLISLPECIQSKFITLQGCTNLMMVPKISCKVEHLDLSGTAIRESPFIEQPSKLVTLNLSNCPKLKILSDSISKCKSLEYLYVEQCSTLGRLPDDFENLDTSETLISKAMSSIVDFSKRPQIRYREPVKWALNYSSSFFKHPWFADRQMMKLPKDLGQLSILKELNLSGNNFESMPASIKELSNLRILNISNCERLIFLPDLPKGINLTADNCSSLESILNSSFLFSPIFGPQRVNFSNCFNLSLSKKLHKEAPREFCNGVCYPGKEIPEWFQFQNIGSSITVELPPDWMNENLLGFNICTVVAFPKGYKVKDYKVSCFCTIKSKNQETEVYKCSIRAWSSSKQAWSPDFLPGPNCIQSDHVFVGFVYGMRKIIRMWAPRDEVGVSKSKVLISFFAGSGVEVKKCGVHFLYEYDDCSTFMISNKEEEDEQQSTSRPEFVHIKGTVRDISEGCSKLCPSDNKNLVGVEIAVQEIDSLLRIGSDGVCMVGIWGLGGTGKTTIAQVLYDKISTEFEGSFFFQGGTKGRPVYVPNEILSNIVKTYQYWLKQKRVLFIFDNIVELGEVQSLIGDPTCLCSGSQTIITSRDKHVLTLNGVKHIYHLQTLCLDCSLQLFSKYAFGQDHPTEDYVELSKIVVEHAGGVPLALKLIGSCLFDKRKQDWEHVVDILQQSYRRDIFEILKVSYDVLNVEARSIFLDVILMSEGWYRFAVKSIFNAKGFSAQNGLSNLVDRSFITISDKSMITMHDLLHEAGTIILRR